jgi:receptor-type tyrosine-protein phosphatase Q/CUB/sushi domain-containing protein
MITDGRRSFVIFLYADEEIQWTTGDASGGTNGFGGTEAQVGFNAGDGIRFASVPGSQTRDIVNIDTTSNARVPGVWVFRVDEEDITVIRECSMDSSGIEI